MVAIKIIEHSADDSSKVDGLREALLCSNIQHPNVVGLQAASSAVAALQIPCSSGECTHACMHARRSGCSQCSRSRTCRGTRGVGRSRPAAADVMQAGEG